MKPDLNRIRHAVLDMDGTLYLGKTLLPQTHPFLSTLSRLGIGYSFVTNNCSRSSSAYVDHLRSLGIEARPDAIVTSAHATVAELRRRLPAARRLYVLGTPDLHDEFRLAGFEVVDNTPDAVVVAFDTGLTYDRLARTAYWLSQGLPFVATHPDRVCPTDQPTVLPDCGALCALFESATGRRPDFVPGKPNPAMLRPILDAHRLPPDQVMVVGDRLYTDMRMALDAGAMAVLTLTGETQQSDLDRLAPEHHPHLVVEHVGDLARLLEEARRGG